MDETGALWGLQRLNGDNSGHRGAIRQEVEGPGGPGGSRISAKAQGVEGHSGNRAHYERAHGKDRQELFLKEVRAGIEEQRTSRMVGKQQQGAWVRCVGQESVLDGDLVGRTPPHQVHGLITIWPHGPMTIAVVSLWHTWCKQEVYMMTVINSDLCSLCENVIKYAPDKGWQKYVSYSLKKL